MPETLRFHDGQAYLEASEREPYPVKVMADVQTANINGVTDQKTVATTTTLIVPANPNRRSIKITQITGSQVVYIGFTPGLTTSNGDYFSGTAGSTITIYAKSAIYGIAVSIAQTVSYMEESFE